MLDIFIRNLGNDIRSLLFPPYPLFGFIITISIPHCQHPKSRHKRFSGNISIIIQDIFQCRPIKIKSIKAVFIVRKSTGILYFHPVLCRNLPHSAERIFSRCKSIAKYAITIGRHIKRYRIGNLIFMPTRDRNIQIRPTMGKTSLLHTSSIKIFFTTSF